MTTTNCYDCGQPMPTREERAAGVRHEHLVRTEPEPGTSYSLERFEADAFTGGFGVDITKDGKTIAGVISGRRACEELLRIRGWRGPFDWPSIAASKAARAARRKRAVSR